MAIMKGVTRLRFRLDCDGTNGQQHYIDLSREISKFERRLHQQKMIYSVVGGFVHDSNQNAFVKMNVLPNHWPMRAAINRGFRIWKKQRSMALKNADAGITTGKWSDFKIHMNAQHNQASVPAYASLGASDAGTTLIPGGEWDYSTLHSADIDWTDPDLLSNVNLNVDSFDLMAVGDSHVPGALPGQDQWNKISLLKSWIDTRAQPQAQDPLVPAALAADPLANMFDASDADDEILNEVNNEGDNPPYDVDTMMGNFVSTGAGNNLQRVAIAHCSAANPTNRFDPFDSICGLLQVVTNTTDAGIVELVIDVKTWGSKF